MWTSRLLAIGRFSVPASRCFSQCVIKKPAVTSMNTVDYMHIVRRGARKSASTAIGRERSEFGLDEEIYTDDIVHEQAEPARQKSSKSANKKQRQPQHSPKSRNRSISDSIQHRSEPEERRERRESDSQPANDGMLKETKAFRRVFSDQSLRVFDADLDLSYVKLRYDNPELQAFMLLTKSKSFRMQRHLLMVEGRRLLLDALNAGLKLQYILFSRHDQLKLIRDQLKVARATPEIIRVPHHDLTFWSVMTTCPGIIGIFQKPVDMEQIYMKNAAPPDVAQELATAANFDGRITVILDQIRDPSNLGSVIRTCAAIPCHQVRL